jgi:glycosyltransferase involved in cell wall biosynthesis
VATAVSEPPAAISCADSPPAVARPAPFRVAAVTSHPVQYQAPLFRALAADHRVDLTVYYGARWGLDAVYDHEFGVTLRWDVPLISGYRARFLPNRGHRRGFCRVLNPGIVGELGRGAYDAVLIHSYANATALLAYIGAWLSRTPVLLRTESELLRRRSPVRRFAKQALLGPLLRGTAAALAIGSANRAFYARHGLPDERIFWTPYGVDNEPFAGAAADRVRHRVSVREELGLAPEQPIVLFVGKLIERKRPRDMLDALARREAIGTTPAAVFVGDGELRRPLEGWIAATNGGAGGASDCAFDVRFVGFQNQSAIARYYAAADVFVLPSAFETWGLVVNEAMASGLPVIVSDGAAAARDLVIPGENGFTYRAGDIDRLSDRLAELLADPARRRAMGARGQAIVGAWGPEPSVAGVVEAVQYACRHRVRSNAAGTLAVARL